MIFNTIKKIFKINWFFTIYFNLKYLSFRDALKLPIVLYGSFDIHKLKGNITLIGSLKFGMIKIGLSSVGVFDRGKKTILNIHGNVVFNDNVVIGRGSSISVGLLSKLVLGKNFKITASSSIIASEGGNIYFGDNCLLSWDIIVISTDFHKIMVDGIRINNPKDIIIGNNVWICTRTVILKGSKIANGCVIGANSLVSGSFSEQNSIYAGIPLKSKINNISWEE